MMNDCCMQRSPPVTAGHLLSCSEDRVIYQAPGGSRSQDWAFWLGGWGVTSLTPGTSWEQTSGLWGGKEDVLKQGTSPPAGAARWLMINDCQGC